MGEATFSAEFRYLLEILAVEYGGPTPRATPDIDWNRFADAVVQHRVDLLIGPALGPGGPMPETVRNRLKSRRKTSAGRVLRFGAELARLATALREGGVDALALKGPAFAALLHGTWLHRLSQDIDLMVPKEAEARAIAVLQRCGYRAADGSDRFVREYNAINLVHPQTGIHVELHTRLVELDALLPEAAMRPFETSVEVMLAGAAVRTLAPERAVLYAANHGARHLWRRLFWLHDMGVAAAGNRVDWPAVSHLARRTGNERHLALGVRLARDLLGAPVPDVVDIAPAGRLAAVLRPALGDLDLRSDQDMIVRINRLRYLGWLLSLHPRPSAWWSLLGAYARPTANDRAFLRLPHRLDGLYYGVRILRVLLGTLRR